MELIEKLKKDLLEATKSKDSTRITTIRLLLSSIKNKEIELKGVKKELSVEDVLLVLQKEAKQRKESIVEFEKGGRADLVQNEGTELKIIEGYLPEQMSEDEVSKIVKKVIIEVGAESNKDMGKVMSKTMEQLRGKADGKVVSEVVKKLLQ